MSASPPAFGPYLAGLVLLALVLAPLGYAFSRRKGPSLRPRTRATGL